MGGLAIPAYLSSSTAESSVGAEQPEASMTLAQTAAMTTTVRFTSVSFDLSGSCVVRVSAHDQTLIKC